MPPTVCFWVLLIASLYSVPIYAVSDQVLAKDLYDTLFAEYDHSLMPICTPGGNVTLDVDLALRQIMELNEREQILVSNIWLRTMWTDCRLRWDPADYNDTEEISVRYQDIWVPDFTMYDSAADEVMFPGKEDYRAHINHDGTVHYNFPTVVKSICRVSVKTFPFDTQKCPLQFGSWSHHGNELDVVHRNKLGDLTNYVENTEWSITSMPVERHVLIYNCCPEPYPDVTFYIIMTRRPQFYLLTMLFPCILTSIVAAFSFMLPVECGEKVELEITTLLSLAVFLLLVSESLPPSSESFPIIGSYFASSMLLVSLSLLKTVVVLNVFYRGTNGRRVPRWAKRIFVEFLSQYLFIRRKSSKVDIKLDEEQSREQSREKCVDPVEPVKVLSCEKISDHVTHVEPFKASHVTLDDTEDNFSPDKSDDTVETSSKDNTDTIDTSSKEGKDSTTNNTNHNSENGHVSGVSGIDKPTPLKRNGLLPSLGHNEPAIGYLKQQMKHLENIDNHLHSESLKEQVNSEWRDLSNVVDRICLILYMLVLIITTLTFLLLAIG